MNKKKPKAATKPKEPSPLRPLPAPSVIAAKLRELGGNQAAVARLYGVTRQSVNALVLAHPETIAACHDARESMKDNAESSLHRGVLAGEAWAVCFYLKTQAKDRGYIEKAEYKIEVESPPITEVIVRSRDEAKAILALMAAKT